MKTSRVTLQSGRGELISQVRRLWNLLFDHHLEIGAAGLAVIPREDSWPHREAHYRRLFAAQPRASIWLARRDDALLGYALSFVCDFEDQPAVVLETLSVDPDARGTGIGNLLMDAVDREAFAEGIRVGIVDVMAGNPRARDLYMRRGYAPYSETWMRSEGADSADTDPRHAQLPILASSAMALNLQLEVSPGPDDTWVSADTIIDLSTTGNSPERNFNVDGGDPGKTQLDDLLSGFATAGFWTLRFELPAEPSAQYLRTMLRERGFRLSTERLVRR